MFDAANTLGYRARGQRARRQDSSLSDHQSLPVDRLEPGHCGTVCEIRADDDATVQLKTMGICTGRRVMLLRRGDPMILRVLGSRIGISARLGCRIIVERCTDDPPEAATR